MTDPTYESLHFPVRILLSLLIYFLPFTGNLFLSFLNTFLAWNVFVALLCGFRVRRGVCAFILSVAVIGLSRHLMNLMKISNLITKVQYIFLPLSGFFHSYFIKAIDHSFYGFTGAINHAGCWKNTRLTARDLKAFHVFSQHSASRNVENTSLRLVFSTFSSCSQMPVVFCHSVIHGLGFFVC